MALTFPDIDPVALWIGPLPIRWYALAYMAGFLLGWRYALYLAGKTSDQRPNRDDIDDFLPWAVLGVILGGRLGYVLFYNFDMYLQSPLSVFKLWQGGMSFHGGMLGVIVALLIYPSLKKISHLRLADIVCACVPIGLFFGRLANFINGELYGRITDFSLGMVFPYGGPEPRHPSQLYEAGLEGMLLFFVLFVMMKAQSVRSVPGLVSGVFVFLYGSFRFLIEFVREPDAHLGLFDIGLSMGQMLSLPMILAGLGLIVYVYVYGRLHDKQPA